MSAGTEDPWVLEAQDTVTSAVRAIVPDATGWTVDVRPTVGQRRPGAPVTFEYNPSFVLVAGPTGSGEQTVLDFDQPTGNGRQQVMVDAALEALEHLTLIDAPLTDTSARTVTLES